MTIANGHPDVVVVGAGHNGLIAACYLARAGLEVLVVERDGQVGGMTSSGRTIPGAPGHVANHCAVDLLFWNYSPLAADLELPRHGFRTIEVDPAAVYLDPDGATLAFWRDPSRTAAEIRRFSPADASAFLEMAGFLDALMDVCLPMALGHPTRPGLRTGAQVAWKAVRHRRELRDFVPFALASGEDAINDRFSHPVTIAALQSFGGIGAVTQQGSSSYLLTTGFLHRRGMHRPAGGMQALPEALGASLRSAGGRIVTSTAVTEICIEGGRAVGVRLADGRVVRAGRAVLATCDPRTALQHLLPDGTLSAELERRVSHLPANAAGWGPMRIDMAFSGRLSFPRHQQSRRDDLDLRIPSQVIGTPKAMKRAYARSGAGLLPAPEDLAFWNVIPNAVDPSQAPPDQDVLYLFSQSMPAAPEAGWKNLKADAEAAMVARAAQFYGGLTELEIGRSVECPDDFAERTGATNGCYMHVDMRLDRVGPFRPALGLSGYRLPVDGLYLGGAGSHPGGGVTGLPGRLSAQEILRSKR